MFQYMEIQHIQQESYHKIKEKTKQGDVQPENMPDLLIHPCRRFAVEEHDQEKHVHQQTDNQSKQKRIPVVERGFLYV
jgi:hypothetical protein